MADDVALKIDPNRSAMPETGIYVRAVHLTGTWDSVDIVRLEKSSLLRWLRSREGDNPLAENVVGILLGHGHLHEVQS